MYSCVDNISSITVILFRDDPIGTHSDFNLIEEVIDKLYQLNKTNLVHFKEKEGKDSDSEFEPDSSEDFPCLCDSCPEEAIKDKNCCQYFAKTKLDCDSGDVDCVLKLQKFFKMMDAVRRIII